MMGITFEGKHSFKDMGVTMAPGKDIGRPNKKKILQSIAFSNVQYDFSELYGNQVYENRVLRYIFNIKDKTKERMQLKSTVIQNWLMRPFGKTKLYDDAIPNYYFHVEVETGVEFEENFYDGTLTVYFDAYPFMIDEKPEGHDIWDDFNFELDVSQPTKFEINGNERITLINAGVPDVFPTITTSEEMEIELSGNTYIVPAGTTNNADLPLKSGNNKLTIKGNGTIDFVFHKELI